MTFVCCACNMTDEGETPLGRAYRLAVCRRCRMFEDGRDPVDPKSRKKVGRIAIETTRTDGSPSIGRPSWQEQAKALIRRGIPVPTSPEVVTADLESIAGSLAGPQPHFTGNLNLPRGS